MGQSRKMENVIHFQGKDSNEFASRDFKAGIKTVLIDRKGRILLVNEKSAISTEGKTAPTKGTEEIINESLCGLSSMIHTIRSVEINTDQGKKFIWEKQLDSI